RRCQFAKVSWPPALHCFRHQSYVVHPGVTRNVDVRVRAGLAADAHLHQVDTGPGGPILLDGTPWRGSVNFTGTFQGDLIIPNGPEVKPDSLIPGKVLRFHPTGKKIFRSRRHDARGTSELRTRIVLSIEGQTQRLLP